MKKLFKYLWFVGAFFMVAGAILKIMHKLEPLPSYLIALALLCYVVFIATVVWPKLLK